MTKTVAEGEVKRGSPPHRSLSACPLEISIELQQKGGGQRRQLANISCILLSKCLFSFDPPNHLTGVDAVSSSLPLLSKWCFIKKPAPQIIWEIVWRASRPDSPCDSRSFSEKFSCDVHMTFMFGNKHRKEFQHFLFFVAVILSLVLWLSKWYMHMESKSAMCFGMKAGNRLPVSPHNAVFRGPDNPF